MVISCTKEKSVTVQYYIKSIQYNTLYSSSNGNNVLKWRSCYLFKKKKIQLDKHSFIRYELAAIYKDSKGFSHLN